MPYPRELDGPRLHTWAARAVAELSARRAEINALNVFPVPDADTGSNMTHTMEAALKEADKLPAGADAPAVAGALASGSVRGARGNSGLVLSQVLRAVADSAARGSVDGDSIARSLTLAVSLVDRAIAEPVEGTVITVLRAAALAAESASGDLHAVVSAALDAARTALRLGAQAVRMVCLEDESEMPAWDWECREALEEGIGIVHRRGPTEVVVRGGAVAGLVVREVERVFDDDVLRVAQRGRENITALRDGHAQLRLQGAGVVTHGAAHLELFAIQRQGEQERPGRAEPDGEGLHGAREQRVRRLAPL